MYDKYTRVVANTGMDDKADIQCKANLHTSLFHDTTEPYYFPYAQICSLLEVEVYSMGMMAEGDWVLKYLVGKLLVNNRVIDGLIIFVVYISFVDFGTKLLSYFLEGSIQLQVHTFELLICNFLLQIPFLIC